jgi:hypothetical protein
VAGFELRDRHREEFLMLDTYNQLLNSFPLSELSTIVDERSSMTTTRCAGALMTAAYDLSPGAPSPLLTGKLVLLDRHRKPRSTRRYGQVHLIEEWLTLEDARRFVADASNGFWQLANARVPLAAHVRHEALISQMESFSTWPETRLTIESAIRPNSLMHVPGVARGVPPHLDLPTAASNWVTRKAHRVHDLRMPGAIVIAVPDLRARIYAIHLEGGILRFAYDDRFATKPIEAQVLFTDEGRTVRRKRFAARTQRRHRHEVEVPDFFDRVDVFLADDEGAVSHVGMWRITLELLSSGPETALAADARRDIAGGETEIVEFKPWIDPADKKKFTEVVQSVVAFANTKGGRIYIGVRDDTELEDTDAPRRVFKTTLENAVATANASYADLIRKEVLPIPPHRIETTVIDERSVLVIAVSAGDRRPYSTHGDIFVRRGASNRKADPQTEVAELVRDSDRARDR